MAQQADGENTLAGRVDALPEWQRLRRQKIVDAAHDALQQQEYEQIQIRDIARSAGVALGTLYRYFSSKEHVYAAVLQAWAAFERPLSPRLRDATPSERVRGRMHRIIAAFERQPQFYKVIVLLQSSSDPNTMLLLSHFDDSAQRMLVEDFAALGPEVALDTATMLWAIISTTLTTAIYRDQPMSDVHRVADRFIDLVAPQLDREAGT